MSSSQFKNNAAGNSPHGSVISNQARADFERQPREHGHISTDVYLAPTSNMRADEPDSSPRPRNLRGVRPVSNRSRDVPQSRTIRHDDLPQPSQAHRSQARSVDDEGILQPPQAARSRPFTGFGGSFNLSGSVHADSIHSSGRVPSSNSPFDSASDDDEDDGAPITSSIPGYGRLRPLPSTANPDPPMDKAYLDDIFARNTNAALLSADPMLLGELRAVVDNPGMETERAARSRINMAPFYPQHDEQRSHVPPELDQNHYSHVYPVHYEGSHTDHLRVSNNEPKRRPGVGYFPTQRHASTLPPVPESDLERRVGKYKSKDPRGPNVPWNPLHKKPARLSPAAPASIAPAYTAAKKQPTLLERAQDPVYRLARLREMDEHSVATGKTPKYSDVTGIYGKMNGGNNGKPSAVKKAPAQQKTAVASVDQQDKAVDGARDGKGPTASRTRAARAAGDKRKRGKEDGEQGKEKKDGEDGEKEAKRGQTTQTSATAAAPAQSSRPKRQGVKSAFKRLGPAEDNTAIGNGQEPAAADPPASTRSMRSATSKRKRATEEVAPASQPAPKKAKVEAEAEASAAPAKRGRATKLPSVVEEVEVEAGDKMGVDQPAAPAMAPPARSSRSRRGNATTTSTPAPTTAAAPAPALVPAASIPAAVGPDPAPAAETVGSFTYEYAATATITFPDGSSYTDAGAAAARPQPWYVTNGLNTIDKPDGTTGTHQYVTSGRNSVANGRLLARPCEHASRFMSGAVKKYGGGWEPTFLAVDQKTRRLYSKCSWCQARSKPAKSCTATPN